MRQGSPHDSLFRVGVADLVAGVATAASLVLVVAQGVVSYYIPWRKSATVPNARYAGMWSRKPTPKDLVCAHRTLPFGSVLVIYPVGRPTQFEVCSVFDRGPYGACVPAKGTRRTSQCAAGKRYAVIVRGPLYGGKYRGEADVTPSVYHGLGRSRGLLRGTVLLLRGLRLRGVLKVGSVQHKRLRNLVRRLLHDSLPVLPTPNA